MTFATAQTVTKTSSVAVPFTFNQDVQVRKGTFTGRVVGIDYVTGGIVCCSHKIANYSNDRTRYVYQAEELEPYVSNEPMTRFKVNKHYTIDKRKCVAVLSESNPACVDIKSLDGVVTYHEVPRNIETRKLKHDFGIVLI